MSGRFRSKRNQGKKSHEMISLPSSVDYKKKFEIKKMVNGYSVASRSQGTYIERVDYNHKKDTYTVYLREHGEFTGKHLDEIFRDNDFYGKLVSILEFDAVKDLFRQEQLRRKL